MAIWNSGSVEASKNRRERRRARRQGQLKRSMRSTNIEQCEPRMMLAVSPQLVAILPNNGDQLIEGQVRSEAPRELVIRFDEGQRIDEASAQNGGIQIVRAGGDGIFGNANDVNVTPDVVTKVGWIGVGDRPNEIVVRFSDHLIDDLYQVRIVGQGPTALRNAEQLAFNNGANRTVQFELDLGPRILAVVPQPITRVNNALVQARNEIEVYFNDDDLDLQAANTPAFYQLIHTRRTADNLDDGPAISPTSVVYDAAADKARLIFADDLASLDSTETIYRLRIGNRYSEPLAPIVRTQQDTGEAADTFTGAVDINAQIGAAALGPTTVVVQGEIQQVVPYVLDLPGGNEEPGHRDLPSGVDAPHVGGSDSSPGITQLFYNFRDNYGSDPQGNPFFNLITPAQKQRAREVFAYYSQYLGVQFVESPDRGLTIATGDLRAVDPMAITGPGGIAGIAGGSTAVMDSAENWGSSEIGGGWFQTAMHEIGHLLGLGHSYDLPALTIQGGDPAQGGGEDPSFPGDNDILHGRHVLRPESTDIDLYRFTLSQTGVFSAETVAERLGDSSLLDTVLWVYNAAGELVARNDDYFSEDSFVEIELAPGDYYVAITSTGMSEINPRIAESGFGGTSEGKYELRLSFTPSPERNPTAVSGIVDSDGHPTLLDGDADGRPGGEYNFWFTVAPAANTFYVDKSATAGGNGSLAAPFNNINLAFQTATARNNDGNTSNDIALVRIVGNGGADGDVATQTDNLAYEVGFNSTGQPLPDGATMQVPRGVTVMVDAGALFRLRRANIDVGSKAQGVDQSQGHLQVLGTPRQSVFFTSYNSRPGQPETPRSGDWGGIVFRNELDNDARPARVLEREGIFVNYINHADFSYGGGDVVVNGVQASFSPIHLNEARPSLSFNRITNSASGAIAADPNSFEETRFSNVGHDFFGRTTLVTGVATIVSGTWPTWATAGRTITIGSRTFTVAARLNNTQLRMTDPPVSANGQLDFVLSPAAFAADYGRVGPQIHDNALVNNTINGLFIQIDTLAGQILDRLEVSARFDDIDITHVLTESLVIAGTPAGPTVQIGGTRREARLDGRLAIDPGIIVKLDHSRIETEIGAEFIAEGRDTDRIVFTSLLDSRFGGVGTFATTQADLGPFTTGTVNVVTGVATLLGGAAWPAWAAGATLTINGTPHRVVSRDSNLKLTLADFFTVLNAPFSLTEVNSPAAGDWAGLVFGPLSHGSLDHALVTFGGGSAAVEGGFASFNPIEIQQADVRLTNSTLEQNDGGRGAGRGLGHFDNDDAVIYVRAAQPVILDDIIRDNDLSDSTSAISINVNALNSDEVHDLGRSRGAMGREGDFVGNQGALVRNNRLSRNSINGMVVRGSTLTTQSVWDDVDMVHVLFDEVRVQNHHTFSGLRLQSSASQSLVIKLQGANAGITASGIPLDIDDRIGGSVYVLGTPGHPVVMTSLFDNTVGAGLDTEGRTQTDTANLGGGSPLPTGPEVNRGSTIDNDVAQGIVGHMSVTVGAGGDVTGPTGPPPLFPNSSFTARGRVTPIPITGDFILDYLGYVDVGSDGGAVPLSQTTITRQPTLIAPDAVESRGNFRGQNATVNWIATTRIGNGQTRMETTVEFSSALPLGNIRYISYLDATISGNQDIMALSGAPGDLDFLVSTLSNTQRVGLAQGGVYVPGSGLQNATWDGWAADVFSDLKTALTTRGTTYTVAGNIDVGPGPLQLPQVADPTLGTIWGPRDVATAFAWSVDARAFSSTVTAFLDSQSRAPSPVAKGDWRSIRLEQYSNDRNVAVVTEREEGELNGDPDSAQSLGQLAATPQVPGADPTLVGPGERGGDDNRRLGFEVHGRIASPGDLDVYTFKGRGGQEVWFDIDRTSYSLDTVIELINASGIVVARSNDSGAGDQGSATGTRVFPLVSGAFAGTDLYTTNTRDAGMRVILPGPANSLNDYYVRVRSNLKAGDSLDDPTKLHAGETAGVYQLQVRLREIDEVPGSTVQTADIRFATNGIELLGVPTHSPLLGESFETTAVNDDPLASQDLGNILKQERGAISVGGALANFNDVDWYRIEVDWQNFQDIPNPAGDFDNTASLVFDFDYADGAGRPDTNFALFDDVGRLIYLSRNSNIADDQPSSSGGSDKADLSRGSFGKFDPYLGPIQLRENDGKTYYLAVSSDSNLPEALSNARVRIEPILAEDRLYDDRVGSSWFPNIAELRPRPKQLFPTNTGRTLDSYADPWHLGDVVLFVHDGRRLRTVDPFTGRIDSDIGPSTDGTADIAMQSDGRLLGFTTDGMTSTISTDDAVGIGIGDDSIQSNPTYQAYTVFDQGNNRILVAMDTMNNIYSFNAANGMSDQNVAGTDNDPLLPVTGLTGVTTGLAVINGIIYGVTDRGQFFRVNRLTGAATVIATVQMPDPVNPALMINIPFSGLSRGPANVEGGAYANRLFATDNLGNLHALEISGRLAPVFVDGKTTVAIKTPTGPALTGLTGLAFSTLDYNLWHATMRRAGDAGHGLDPTPDGEVSRLEPIEGGQSYWFGLEQGSTQPGVAAYQSNNTLYNTYSLPGGAHGTLTTDTFSLADYAPGDAPTFYFTYRADHDTGLDSFRIHVSNDGANWFLLDQTPVPQQYRNVNPFVANIVNDAQWRQARVDLSQFAGLDNLRIRFDFNTLGGRDVGVTDFTGTPLSAVPGVELFDGDSFSLLNPQTFTVTKFEFDMGLGLNVPYGAATGIQDGETLTISNAVGPVTFEFDKAGNGVAAGNRPIVITESDSAATVATSIGTAITTAAIAGVTVQRSGQRISLVGASNIQQSGSTLTIQGNPPGTLADPMAIPIVVHVGMTANDVALAIARKLDNYYAVTVNMQTDIPTLFTSVKVDGPTLYIIGKNVLDQGPLSNSITRLPGDYLILGPAQRAEQGRANSFEGVFVDDFVIGFAERGEIISQAPADTSYIPEAVRPVGKVLEGAYQFEVRRGFTHGIASHTTQYPYILSMTRGFAANDRLADGITMTAPVPSAISPGTTFTIDDGYSPRTFEFNLSGNPASISAGNVSVNIAGTLTAVDVARAISQAINADPILLTTATFESGSPVLNLARAVRFESSVTPIVIEQLAGTDITLRAKGPASIQTGTTFTINDGDARVVFEFTRGGPVTTPGNRAVNIATAQTPAAVAQAMAAAINAASQLSLTKAQVVNVNGDTLQLGNVVDFAVKGPDAILATVFDDQDKWGDQNLFRDQGQILIHNNSISKSSGTGIVFDAAARDAATNAPHPGPVRNLIDFNTARLVPSVSIANNLIANNDAGGIFFSGDPGVDPQSPVPFGRIYNNTIRGGDTPTGIGVLVNENASPTLLNNVLASLDVGIQVDASSTSTQIGSSVYHRNNQDVAGAGLGALAVVVPRTEEIFVDPVHGNFYPSAGSKLIDSGRDSLEDRLELTAITNPIGIPASPILSPERDMLGQKRVDDGSVNNTGLGQNPFKDRGALERADFSGPTAILVEPADNDPTHRDLNAADNFVRLGAETLTGFAVQIIDGILPADPAVGVGVNDVTVNGGQFKLFRDGVQLTQGVDYFFSYDPLTNIARFLPALGIWPADHTYLISLNNDPLTGIKDIAGNVLRPNDVSGATQFTIELNLVDFGDAPADPPYPTLFAGQGGQPGAYHAIVAGLQLGSSVTAEVDGQPSVFADDDTGDDGVVFGQFLPGAPTSVSLNVVRSGIAADVMTYVNAWIDFNGDGDWNDAGEQVFTNQAVLAGNNDLTIDVPATAMSGLTYARFRLSTQQDLTPGGAANDGEVEDYRIEILPLVHYDLQLNYASSATQLFRDGLGQYFVSPGLEVTAEVYVQDLRSVNAAGVQQAFADLIYNNDLIDWAAGSLTFGPSYSTGQSGTLDDAATPQVDEAGGVAPNETGGGRQLLFRLTGAIKDTAPADSTFTLTLDPADVSPAHDTLLFNVGQPLSASYDSETVVVKQLAWQNARNPLDANADGLITALDALVIINRLNGAGPGVLDPTPSAPDIPRPFFDANGDGNVTALDALAIINHLNTVGPGPVSPPPPAQATFAAAGEDTASPIGIMADVAPLSIKAFATADGTPLGSSFDVTPVAVSIAASGSTAVAPALTRAAALAAAEVAANMDALDRTIAGLFDRNGIGAERIYSSAIAVDELAESLAADDAFVFTQSVVSLDTLVFPEVASSEDKDIDSLFDAWDLDNES